MKKIIIFLCFIFSLNTIEAQEKLRGTVMATETQEALVGAVVRWVGEEKEGTVSNEEGIFELLKKTESAKLVIQFIGYKTDTFRIEATENDLYFPLQVSATAIADVTIKARKEADAVSTLKTRNVESISSSELKKAPCCNLSESFETSGAVDVSYSDAVTGAKEIQMLGLRGLYTQLTTENRPDLYGLGQPYALEYLAGTWLSNISISKGVGSVLNGSQAMTGQINTEIVKPYQDKRLFVNLYSENTGRAEVNVHLNKKLNERWSTGLLLHSDYQKTVVDRNDDGFTDVPLKVQQNAMYRLFYEGTKLEGQFNIHALTEERNSGQLVAGKNYTNPFTVSQKANRIALSSKIGYVGFKAPYRALGSQFSATYHDLKANYGDKTHSGTQRSFYGNLLYADIFGTTDHKITYATSFQSDHYDEYFRGNFIGRYENIWGIATEYTYNHTKLGTELSDFTVIAGLRADVNNLYGTKLAPRLNFKYNPEENTVFRLTTGRGYRTANVIAENVGVLASNRQVVLGNGLRQESAWNFGVNMTKAIPLGKKELKISLDAYRTVFENQIIVDMESDHHKVQFYNLIGKSTANNYMALLTYEPIDNLDIKLAYKLNDTKITYANEEVVQQLFLPRHRGLLTLDYKTPNEAWRFHFTSQYVGHQRLMHHEYLPFQYHVEDGTSHTGERTSPDYTLFSAQVTRKIKAWEIYLGAENVGNFVQKNPIIAADNSDSEYFDATQIYAPLLGRRIYLGLRWGI